VRAVTSQVLGSSLEALPETGSSKLGAENEVAGGDIDGIRWNVNGPPRRRGCQIMLYEFVMTTCL